MFTYRICKLLAVVLIGCGLFVGAVSVFASEYWTAHTKLITHTELIAHTELIPDSSAQQDGYLSNPNFECATGVYTVTDSTGQPLVIPDDWIWAPISGTPKLISTRLRVTGNCDVNSPGFVDRIEGEDSFMFRSADIETPPVPGKPFDVAIYQQVEMAAGVDYSISGFMASLCGGSASPNDCPSGYYISKMVGLDPNAGVDPLASSILWADNREPHTTAGYANVSVAARATNATMTAFIRIRSPFQWHGNHAIIDDFRMVEAPTIALTNLPNSEPQTGTMGIPVYSVNGSRVEIHWAGDLSNEIRNLDGELYELNADVQYRRSDESGWQNMVSGHVGDGCQVFVAPALGETVQFRAGALAARPTTGGHRFRSRWSDPIAIQFLAEASTAAQAPDITNVSPITTPVNQLFLPIVDQPVSLACSNLDAEGSRMRVRFPEGKLEVTENDLTLAQGETVRFLVDAGEGDRFVFQVLTNDAQSISGDATFPNGEPYSYSFASRLELASSRTTIGDFQIRMTNEGDGPITYDIRVKRVLPTAAHLRLDSLLAKFTDAGVSINHLPSTQNPTEFDEVFKRDITTREILYFTEYNERVDVFIFSNLATVDEATALIELGSNRLMRTVDGKTHVAKLFANGGAVPYWWRDGPFLLFTSSPDPIVVERVSAVFGEPLGQSELGEVNLRLRNSSDATWPNVIVGSTEEQVGYGPLPLGVGGYQAVPLRQSVAISVTHDGEIFSTSIGPLEPGKTLVDLALHNGNLRARPFKDLVYMKADDLLDRTWIWERLERADGTSFVPYRTIAFSPTLRFLTSTTTNFGEAGLHFGGKLGCNGMGGLYFVNVQKDLLITSLSSTAALCQEPLMENDRLGMTTLLDVDRYEQERNELRLISLAGDQLIFSEETKMSAADTIYADIINRNGGGETPFLIVTEPKLHRTGLSIEEVKTQILELNPYIDTGDENRVTDELMDAFFDQPDDDMTSIQLPNGEPTLIPQTKVDALFAEGNEAGWQALRAEYPDVNKIFTFSNVAFVGNKGLLYFEVQSPGYEHGNYSIRFGQNGGWQGNSTSSAWSRD